MPFVQAKCENCGAVLSVDSTSKAAICPHCGSAYVVQDAINYYNSVTNVEHLHADVVNVVDNNSAEARFEAAEAYMKLRDFDNAEREFNRVIGLTPQDYRGWWGRIRAKTKEFSLPVNTKKELDQLEKDYQSVQMFAPEEKLVETRRRWNPYFYDQSQRINALISKITNSQREINGRMQMLNQQMKEKNEEILRAKSIYKSNLQRIYPHWEKEYIPEKPSIAFLVQLVGGPLAFGGILWLLFSRYSWPKWVMVGCVIFSAVFVVVHFVDLHKHSEAVKNQQQYKENQQRLNAELGMIQSNYRELENKEYIIKSSLKNVNGY